MRAVRFGSYSMLATLAGMPNLSRRKSMRRYCRLCPPLIYRLVMCPLLLRPPVRRSGSSSVFSGSVASECTRNAYSLRAPYAADDFSVITGRTIVSCSSGIARLLRFLLGCALIQRADLHHHGLRPEDLVRRRVGEAHHVHAGDVA